MEYTWLTDNGIISENYLKQLIYVDKVVKKVRNGGGPNRPALLDYRTLPVRYREKAKKVYGADPLDTVKREPMVSKIKIDYKAYEFFSNYTYPDGTPIPTSKQDNILLWSNNAGILNTLRDEMEAHTRARATHGRRPLLSQFYKNAAKVIKDPAVNEQFPNNLPTNPRRLREKLESYTKHGYESLVKHYKGNANAKKVTSTMEKLILALYAMPNKPYMATVHELYTQFLSGDKSIIDEGTGEIFNPADFRRKGKPIQISESTINNYINKPGNRVLVDRLRNDAKYFKDRYEPHHHRMGPQFSLSKISMDDRDIPNSDVKAYYAYDITSGAVIGKSYTESPSVDWVVDCIRDMFANLQRNNLPVPMEVEVEQFLMNRLGDTVMKEGSLFKYIRWCNPGNSQEKWAETGNRLKKLGAEKNNQEGIGRFYSKLEANRPKQVMEWDDEGRRVKDRTRSFEQAVADDLKSIEQYNNSIPKSHARYPGKTRLQILHENVNPQCMDVNPAVVARQIGQHTTTTIRRSQYVTVQYEKYNLPSPKALDMLKPNNYTVDAYYLPDFDGNIPQVYLYQGGVFICECSKIEKYNTARAERTDADAEAYTNQAKYVSTFRKKVKNGKNSLPKIQVMDVDSTPTEPEKVEVYVPKNTDEPTQEPDNDFNDNDYENNALNDF